MMSTDPTKGNSNDAGMNASAHQSAPGQQGGKALPSLPSWATDDIPLDRPNAARMYDYFLGGYHNFAIDRAAAEDMIKLAPEFPLLMQVNRAFLRRAVKFFVQQGIDQFLDIGSGIPTVGNVHEVAQQLNPAARVVYVDKEPVAVRHSQAILRDTPNVTIIEADACRPEELVHDPEVRRMLDFSKPIGVLIVALLHFVPEDEVAYNLVRVLRDAVAPGSYIAISHGSTEEVSPDIVEQSEQIYARTTDPLKLRSRAEIEAFFAGLDLVEPGLVYAALWRPEGPDDLFLDHPEGAPILVGVGQKRAPNEAR